VPWDLHPKLYAAARSAGFTPFRGLTILFADCSPLTANLNLSFARYGSRDRRIAVLIPNLLVPRISRLALFA